MMLQSVYYGYSIPSNILIDSESRSSRKEVNLMINNKSILTSNVRQHHLVADPTFTVPQSALHCTTRTNMGPYGPTPTGTHARALRLIASALCHFPPNYAHLRDNSQGRFTTSMKRAQCTFCPSISRVVLVRHTTAPTNSPPTFPS